MFKFGRDPGINDYNEYAKIGNEIKETVDGMRREIREEVHDAAAPKKPVICPFCGAATVPDANGRCEYCGSPVG